ncbi:unnamed protein product, partial [Linum tenue]
LLFLFFVVEDLVLFCLNSCQWLLKQQLKLCNSGMSSPPRDKNKLDDCACYALINPYYFRY